MSKFTDLFRDRNDVNEKVIVGYISFGIMIIFAILDIVSSYLGKTLLVHQYIFDAFLYLTLGSFGISSVDKYTNKRNSRSDRYDEDVDDDAMDERYRPPSSADDFNPTDEDESGRN